jgi:beta-N-acetylhexosaminidase
VAAALAGRVAAAGIGWALAPVADVNSAPDNPVIGVRSYGPTPALVARHVAAAVTGIQSAGVAACAKHFPGHGDTSVDSHLGLATVGPDLAGALEPFRAAVAAGVATVMTGHLLVPGYGDLPATLNPALVDGLLRAELGFDGVVVSDALEMGAIAGSVGVGEGAVLALLAGVDALCLGGDETGEPIADAARDALVAAVRSGRLAEERLASAAVRVRALAGRFPGSLAALGLVAARRGLRSAGDVRLGSGAPVVVRLDPAPTIAVGRSAWGLDGLLPGATELVLGPDDPLPPLPADRPLVLVARDATRVGWVGRAVTALLAARPDAVVVEMGLPGPVPPARGWIATGGASAASARAAAELLLGTAP